MSLAAVALVAVSIGAITGLSWWFSSEQVTRRALARVKATSVRDAKDGEIVKVVGRAIPMGPLLRAPVSERACLAWSIAIQVRRGAGKNRRWREVHQGSDALAFLLEDDTGQARIDVHRARIVLSEDHRAAHGGSWSDGSEDLLAYCAEQGIDTSTFVGGSVPVRSREGAIDPGETVAVMGVARWEEDPSASGDGYRSVGKRLVLEAPADAPLLVSDHLDVQG